MNHRVCSHTSLEKAGVHIIPQTLFQCLLQHLLIQEVCGDDSFCLFDIAATKRVEIGAATMEGQEMLETIVEMSKPSELHLEIVTLMM